MQALHHKLDVVLVQILPYNCSDTDYIFCEDSPPSRTPPSTRMRVSPSDPFSPSNIFFHPPPLVGVWEECPLPSRLGTPGERPELSHWVRREVPVADAFSAYSSMCR